MEDISQYIPAAGSWEGQEAHNWLFTMENTPEEESFLDKVRSATDDAKDAELIEEIKRLIQRKPLLKVQFMNGRNCFQYIRSVKLARFIHERDQSLICKSDSCKRSPIHDAAICGRLSILGFIAEIEPTELRAKDKTNRTPLLYACRDGHIAIVNWILTRDSSTLNHVDGEGKTALHFVAYGLYFADHDQKIRNLVECAKLLQRKEAEVRQSNKAGSTAVVPRKNAKMSSVKSSLGDTPVMIARRRDKESKLTLFLEVLEKHDETIAETEPLVSTLKALSRAMYKENQKAAAALNVVKERLEIHVVNSHRAIEEFTAN